MRAQDQPLYTLFYKMLYRDEISENDGKAARQKGYRHLRKTLLRSSKINSTNGYNVSDELDKHIVTDSIQTVTNLDKWVVYMLETY